MATSPKATLRGPQYRLFDSYAVGTAAFFCLPAGAILIAVNYVRLGKTGRAVVAVILGFMVTALLFLIKWSWPTASGSLDRLEYDAFQLVVIATAWFCTWKIAKEEQGDAVRSHVARGGQLGSSWVAGWIAIATWVALIAMVATVVLCLMPLR